MPYAKPEALVGTDWLAAHLDDPAVRIIDASHHLPTTGRKPRPEYDAEHIPGAAFFDIDGIADRTTDLPHMLPDEATFAAGVGALGIGNAHKVVVYDTIGTTGAARVWWTFRAFGHRDVSVLDGGLPKWKAEGRPLSAEPARYPAATYDARLDRRLVRSLEQVRANIDARAEQVLDARSAGRFRGTEPEPRAGLRGGHIPGSCNLPSTALFQPDRSFKPAEELDRLFREAGIDSGRPIVTTCGSGVTAAVLALGLYLIGRDDVAVYDGSWSEWGGRADVPVET
ncbi:MAG: 3-mercaptopyruvate sulfurtransferase [Alphaproteobacteria bacterium]